MNKYYDEEGTVHYSGPAVAVNLGLCGNNDHRGDDTVHAVDCKACLAIVRYVKSNGRKG